ncbi:MAG: hypothetical protein EOO40_08995, partial [Deltaproteobacteria bacterium]
TAVPLPGRAPSRPKGPTAQERARSLSKVNRALDALKQRLDGAKDGSPQGDSEVAVVGDSYETQVSQCLQRNYVIEGYDARRAAGLHATVLIKIQADGTFFFHQIMQSSGVVAFDQGVNRAVVRCGRVAAPPAERVQALRRLGLEIDFRP